MTAAGETRELGAPASSGGVPLHARISVVLADGHRVVRVALRAVLGRATDIGVVGEADDGAEAVALVQRLRPDVLVADLSMRLLGGIDVARAVRTLGLPTRVLVLTMQAEDDQLLPALEAGASGYLLKTGADRDLADAIRCVACGEGYLRAAAMRSLERHAARLTVCDDAAVPRASAPAGRDSHGTYDATRFVR